MRIIALINPHARRARLNGQEPLRDRLGALFGAHGVTARVEFASGNAWSKAAARAVDAAKRGEADAIAVGGGDGSIGAVAGLLAGTGIPLGVLPLGTLNHFARDLGIPGDLESAVAVIARERTRTIDLAEVNGETFVNNSSVGVYSILVLDRERRQNDHKLSKWLAMILSCLRLLRRFSLRRLTVVAAGRRMHHRTPLVFVGNNAYRLRPPEFGTRERLDAGKLWVCVARQQTGRQILWLACRAFLGLPLRLHELEVMTDDNAEIDSRASRLPVALDGEVRMMRTPLRYRARPASLLVFAPDTANDVGGGALTAPDHAVL